MLPSEELLNKYRAAEKSGTSEPGAEQTSSEPATETSNEQVATAGESESQQVTNQNHESEDTEGHKVSPKETKDEWTRHQKAWEKRFKRQDRAHKAEIDDLKRQLAEALGQNKKEDLKPEDFSSRADYDEYKERRMAENVEASILEKQRAQKETEDREAKEREEADKKLNSLFKTPERVAQFKETLNDFYEEEEEYLDSEEGQLFQEFCDNSPVGLFMVEQIAKSEAVISKMKGWSKDFLLHQLSAFEKGLIAQIKSAQDAAKAAPTTQATEKKPVPVMPSTGPVGKSTPSTGKFSAVEYLRKRFPERYRH